VSVFDAGTGVNELAAVLEDRRRRRLTDFWRRR
jgi:hypothetical protein